MGNDVSQSKGVEVEEEAVEVTDCWSLHYANVISFNASRLSAFVSQNDQNLSKNSNSRLQMLARNLMLHRHPCILRYYSTWVNNNKFYLATEEVKPLSQVITSQTVLQICLGLHNIVKALIFLHDQALSSHNNVCCSSIYVTPDGVWKLGGLEYLKKFSEVTHTYLQSIRSKRYEKCVPPEEDSTDKNNKIIPSAIDKYAFGVLAEEVLKKKSNEEISSLSEFRDLCKKQLQSSDPDSRIDLKIVVNNLFFNHDFIRIHSFLTELPLKLNEEKQTFFRDLTEQLQKFDEKIVASQLCSHLLSRLVLLDQTAQQYLLPNVLCPKLREGFHSNGLFTELIYKDHVVPKLLQMFCVRDSHIRMLLLTHFSTYCGMFSKEQLQFQVLPELLVGIKDTNDQLVSVTLQTLSTLVLILGSSTVIGGKRGHLFTDGRPSDSEHRSKSSVSRVSSSSVGNTAVRNVTEQLPERPSPDGGEDHSSTSTTVEEMESEACWSDWDLQANVVDESVEEESTPTTADNPTTTTKSVKVESSTATTMLPDITSLDIKNSTSLSRKNSKTISEVDYFQDMEPVISKTQVVTLTHDKFQINNCDSEDGWECDDLESEQQ